MYVMTSTVIVEVKRVAMCASFPWCDAVPRALANRNCRTSQRLNELARAPDSITNIRLSHISSTQLRVWRR